MSLHSDLLAQAQFLAQREPRRPRQASLRRAVSAAYYSLFHLLIYEASRQFVRDDAIVCLINRTYSHSDMNKVSKSFAKGGLPKKLEPIKAVTAVPDDLKDVAQAFVDLQQARHEADYNLGKSFSRSEALTLIGQAAKAFQDWAKVRNSDISKLYLACFLLWDDWDKVR
jgi:uncharacterized protein (UPF0332 family)